MGDRSEVFRAEVEKRVLGPGERVLLEEACRLIDRSDRLEAIVSGDLNEWLSIDWPYEEGPARLVIGSVVSEARQTTAELRQVVRALGEKAKVVPEAPAAGKSKVDEIAERRRKRRTG